MSSLTPSLLSVNEGFVADCDVLIAGAGFEDRATKLLFRGKFSGNAICILVVFDRSIEVNIDLEQRYMKEAHRKFSKDRLLTVELPLHDPRLFDASLGAVLASIPRSHRKFMVDISGLPSHAICTVLRLVRQFRSLEEQSVMYTAAIQYTPSRTEYNRLKNEQPEGISHLKRAMALEMSQNFIPDSFAGHRTNDGKTALAVFAGYEVHRSAGVIENINPSVLLLLYGRPGDSELGWRLDLSEQLHAGFVRVRRCATERVSTLDVCESLKVLEAYYDRLFDDYDLTITPVCSKMHAVAAYLFWERYKEIQLAFPLPVGYDPKNRPVGIGHTYLLSLPPSRVLARDF